MSASPHELLARWRREPVRFIEQVLHDPETDKPFELLPAERTFLQHAFATDDDGRLLYPEQVFGAPKKSGKTAFAALHALTLTLLFGGRFGEAVCVANDFEQAQGRVFAAMKRIVECSPLLKREAKITVDRIVFFNIGVTCTALASDYASAAGGNQNIAIFDELWAYTTERAHRLWDEMVPPPTRKIACRLTVTYAGFTGESDLLEKLHRRGSALAQVAPDLHAGDGMLMFWSHVPIAPWQDERWLAEMRRSLRPQQYRRMIENYFVAAESTFIDLAWWDACVDTDMRPVLFDPSLPIWVGVDASVKHDSTAIVAVTFDVKAKQVRLVWHRIFQPSAAEPLNFEKTIEATLLQLTRYFAVRQVLYDPYQMASTAQRLLQAGVRMQEYAQTTAGLTATSQNLYDLVKGRNLAVYPDAGLRLAVSRAVAVEGPRGWRIAKDKQSHRIDVVVALSMAALAAVQNQSGYDIAALAEGLGEMLNSGSMAAYRLQSQWGSSLRGRVW